MCDNKESPWVNNEITFLIEQKCLIFCRERENNNFDVGIRNKLLEYLTNVITNLKLVYHRQIVSKLSDPKFFHHSKIVC